MTANKKAASGVPTPEAAQGNNRPQIVRPAEKTGNAKHVEARRLLALGFKLCTLEPMSKIPVGLDWQKRPVRKIDDGASGYGMLLAKNSLCSIDPDNVEPARAGLARCGFELDKLMAAGIRTTSTRPGSGGRSTFKAPEGLKRVKFASKTHGTILELRAGNSNLQDCLPGTVYVTTTGGPYEQQYADPSRTMDLAPELPADFLDWWERLDSDLEYRREQELLFCGADANQSVSNGSELAFKSAMRKGYNGAHSVVDILERHQYANVDGERWAPHTASGAPCVRAIPGKDGLWQSDHASDPLCGTFDAWTAFVVLDHGGEQDAAESSYEQELDAAIDDEFDIIPNDAGDQPAAPGSATVEPATEAPKPKRFKFCMMGEIKKRPRSEWLIKNVFPHAEVGSVVGETGAGKSFFVLDMVLAIARGVEWNGKRVRQGNVAYVVAEGGGRFDQRTDAYGQHYGIDLDTFAAFQVLTAAPNLMEDKDVRDLLSALGDLPDLRVVVLDTLAQVTPGANENSGEDMGRALATAKRIHKRTGATVLIVAHTGKDASRGMRGWSGMKAAMDFEITVERAGEYRAATVTKMKDGGGEGAVYTFKLNMVDLGYVDGDGEEVQSCIVECGTTGPRPTAKKVKLDDDDRRVLQSAEALVSFGDVSRTDWREDAVRKLNHVASNNRHRKADSAIAKLIAGGHIVCGDGDTGLVQIGIPVVRRGKQ